MDRGIQLGNLLLKKTKEQRNCYTRLANGKRLITNHIVYNSLEEELYNIQKEIGKENKKLLKKQGII